VRPDGSHGFSPLTVLRLVRGRDQALVVFGWPGGPWRAVTGCGRSGRGRRRAARAFEQVHLAALAVPAVGEVDGEVAAAVPGGARGHVDEVTADGGAPGPGVGEAGRGTGGAEQVAADGGEGEPGRVGGEGAIWEMAQAGLLARRMASSTRAWTRWAASM
jgi:hypothetical protein